MPTTELLEGCSQALKDVLSERQRQMEVEGWSIEHDDSYHEGEMAIAAASYAMPVSAKPVHKDYPPFYWPWSLKWWKPSTYRRNLVKAAALIIAEIERLDRKEKRSQDI